MWSGSLFDNSHPYLIDIVCPPKRISICWHLPLLSSLWCVRKRKRPHNRKRKSKQHRIFSTSVVSSSRHCSLRIEKGKTQNFPNTSLKNLQKTPRIATNNQSALERPYAALINHEIKCNCLRACEKHERVSANRWKAIRKNRETVKNPGNVCNESGIVSFSLFIP